MSIDFNKVLITGVAGFIGSHLADFFLKSNIKVIGVDDLSIGKEKNVPEGVEFYKFDLSDKNKMSILPNDCQIILHLAGQSSGEMSFDDPVLDLKKNTQTTLNLINYGIENKSQKFVYASSMSIYGETPDKAIKEDFHLSPLSCYGVSKLASENYLKVFSNKLPYVSLRMFNVYGFGQDLNNLKQGMVSIFLSQAITDNKIIVKGNLNRFRDFIYIDDVIKIWYEASKNRTVSNCAINVGTGIKTSVSKLLNIILLELKNREIIQKQGTTGDQYGIYADVTKLRKTLYKSQFTCLETGIKNFISNI